jgi:hypothetical protein
MPRRAAVLLLVCLAALPAAARDVDGVQVPDRLTLAGVQAPLVLNGAGYRKKFFIKVYIGALYLTEPVRQAEPVLAATTPRVMRMHFVHSVSRDKLASAWQDGIVANHTPAEVKALQPLLERFNPMMRDMKVGDVLRLDLLAGGSTRVSINNELRGTLDGVDFQRALLKAWLGEHPADKDLKQALLSGSS